MAGVFERLRKRICFWRCVAALAATLALAVWTGFAAEATPRCLYAAALASTMTQQSGGRFLISNNCPRALTIQFCVRHPGSKWACPRAIQHVQSSTRGLGMERIWHSIDRYSYDGRYTAVLAAGETRRFTEGKAAAEGDPLLLLVACKGRRYRDRPSGWIPGAWLDAPAFAPPSQYRCGHGGGGRQLVRRLSFR